MSSLVRAASLTNYSEVARAAGLDPVRMLFDAGLSPGVLREPDLMIPVERVGQLLQASATLSGNESFGLCMAESRLLSNLGAVGLLIRDQGTLRDSLDVLMRYQALLNDALSLAVEECGEQVIIREVVMAGNAHQPTRQRVELALGVMVRLIRQLLKADWQPRRVCFEHPAPRDASTHQRFFGPCVEFDYDFNGIVCAKTDLDARNPSADPAMVRYAQQLLDASAMSHHATMLEDVRRTILLLLPSGRCSIEHVAEHLGVVCRTAQRRLAEQGLSFSSIVNDIRKELVTRHVIESDRPLTEVAALLGFSEPSGFSRWYHAQFGCSANESRATRGTVRRHSSSTSSLVRAASLTNYSEVARAAGLDPVRMLFDAGLSPGVLREPDLMIPVERVGQLLQASATLSGNESFGLCMAESRRLSELGAVGLLIRDQATPRDSLDVLMRYQALLNGALSLAVEECGEQVIIREAVIAGSAHQPTRQRVELALGVMVRLIRQLLKADWQPRRVCFEHPAPRDASTHQRFFGRCVEFDYDFNCIICAKSDLDARNPSADPAMVRYAQQLLDASVMSHHATMLEDVRRTILLLLPSGRCGIEQVAEHLGVVCRTVQRRLAEQGQSFSSIENDIRKELSTRHVIESDRPLTEVATLLGFSAPSAFARWYHAQFGCSAKESRATRGTVRGQTAPPQARRA